MAEYHIDEAIFDLAPSWHDQSINALWQAIDGGTDKLALTVGREPAPPRKTLADLVERALEQQRQRLGGFELIDRADDLEVGGVPAIGVRVQWRNDEGPVYHRHVYVIAFDRFLTFSGTCKWKHRAACDRSVDEILATLVFRERRT